MGYYFCIGQCVRCHTSFTFNPDRVPSIRLKPELEKEPICPDCFNDLNRVRANHGLEPWILPSGAYEPASEFPEESDYFNDEEI